ncbi:hypothetical protein ES703_42316 [subsurface metagenome]
MATWASQSFALVAQGGYLDRLADIYPVATPIPRHVQQSQVESIKTALTESDDKQLLVLLFRMKKFPFNDPYVSFLRENSDAISSNPVTVSRICSRLRTMGLDNVIKGLEEPRQANRQMGALFNRWLHSKYEMIKDIEEFQSNTQTVVFLDVSGQRLRDFANKLGCGLQKQPDFVAKSHGKYVVGEAKFIGTEGGNQKRGFDDALLLASRVSSGAITSAILDGIIWIPNSGQMSRSLDNFPGNALTALLLDDFLNSI